MNFFNKIADVFKNNLRIILFVFIFISVCFVFNLNNQSVNFFLKRGIVLEYSVSKNEKINKDIIEKKLIEEKVEYSLIKEVAIDDVLYDKDNKRINKLLYIGLPLLPDKNNKKLINDISDLVFENSNSAKLLNVKTLNDFYHKPFVQFLIFLNILALSLVLWLFVLYFICCDKKCFLCFKNAFISFCQKRKENFKDLINKTKERGAGYFLKQVFFDDAKDGDKNDIMKEIVGTILFVLISVILIRYFVGELRWIPSGSMRPTILEKDRVFVEKLNYPVKKEIKRGDILVFYPPEAKLSNDFLSIFARLSGIFCKDVAFIKRVIGMPNDKFEIKYNKNIDEYRVYINDEALDEPYIISKNNWTPCIEKMHCGPFVIPEGHYFMMGDNRGNSQDSRFWGFLPQERIIGRANFMFWPISRINIMTDKYIKLHEAKKSDEYIERDYLLNRYELLYRI